MKTILFSAALLCLSFTIKAQTDNQPKADGNYVVYHKNGAVKAKGNYLNSKREGEWIYFHDNGNVALKKNFSNGNPTGEWAYYNENGSLVMKVDDITKIEKSAELTYYKNNKLVTKTVLVNGKKVKLNKADLNNKF